MEVLKTIFRNAWPYQDDQMNLPVNDLENSIPFYERVLGFKVESRKREPYQSVVLSRDKIKIGLSENGGDPTQDGCFFEVDNIEAAAAELESTGHAKIKDFTMQKHGETSWKVFFVIAPDGLCYCLGEKQ
jgi:predicted enzyme related to lactoylglutathione lyase